MPENNPPPYGPPGSHPETQWWAPWFKKVEELWDWYHTHVAESKSWWREQRGRNDRVDEKFKTIDERFDVFDTRIRSLEWVAAKAALGAFIGGALVALIALLVDKV